MPDNRGEVVEADHPAMFLDGCMERHNHMAAGILRARQATVGDHDHQSAPRDKASNTVAPDLVEFCQEIVVAGDVPELAVASAVLLQCPVRRRRDNEMY